MKRIVILAFLLVAGAALLVARLANAQTASTHYVSPTGSGADGRSWATAWREADQINWGLVRPGDVVEFDGGPNPCPAVGDEWLGAHQNPPCGIVYNTPLVFGASGLPGLPVTVRLSTEDSRDGTAIFDANNTNFKYCAENKNMTAPPTTARGPTRSTAIDLAGRSWVVLDGGHWGGLVARNAIQRGVDVGQGSNVVVRYVKAHHNNNPADTTNSSNGINVQGEKANNILLEHVEVYRNGQDALRLAGDNVTLRESYIHDTYCNHPDGIQSLVFTQNSGVGTSEQIVENLTIDSNIFFNVDLQAVFLGENANHQSWNRGARIVNNLFTSNASPPTRYYIKTKHQNSQNFEIAHNTFHYSTEFGIEWCCAPAGSTGAISPMRVHDNIFLEINQGASAFYFNTRGGATAYLDNCRHKSGGINGVYVNAGEVTADPLFVKPNRSAVTGDYALRENSPCAGRGSTITNLAALLALDEAEVPGNIVTPTATETVLPTATTPATATDVPTETATLEPTGTATATESAEPNQIDTATPAPMAAGCWDLRAIVPVPIACPP